MVLGIVFHSMSACDPHAIVIFADPDSLPPVSVLESTTEQGDLTEFRPTTVGKHLEEKMSGGHNLGK